MATRKAEARWAGAIYVVMSLVGMPVLIYFPRLIVPGDAATTAHNVLSSAGTYRLLLLGYLISSFLFLVLGWALYHLFESVDRRQATLMRIFVVASAVIGVLDAALLAAPLVVLNSRTVSAAFARAQVETLALGLFEVRSVELHANEAFWGLWLIPFGILVIKSGFIPKVIGVLLLIASTGYLAMSFAFIGLPQYVEIVSRFGEVVIQGELAVILWLVIMGAKAPGPSTQQSAVARTA